MVFDIDKLAPCGIATLQPTNLPTFIKISCTRAREFYKTDGRLGSWDDLNTTITNIFPPTVLLLRFPSQDFSRHPFPLFTPFPFPLPLRYLCARVQGSQTPPRRHPLERYIPPFYKRCTLLFWLILATSALYMIGKFYLKRRL